MSGISSGRPWGSLPRGEFPGDGLVVVDKDAGVTSHDVVVALRRLAGTRKVGHAGTLDPMATGVLCVGLGRATKLLRYVTGTSKEYVATVRLGVETSTEDAEGEVVVALGVDAFDARKLPAAMAALRGTIEQVPSAVSALKVGGRRAHELVRAGERVDLEARPVDVHAFDLLGEPRIGTQAVDLDVRVVCGAGTYVRALARDLGRALGTGAHLTSLRRTRVGAWGEEASHAVRELAGRVDAGGGLPLVGVAELCESLFPRIEVTGCEAVDLTQGRFVAGRDAESEPRVGDSRVAAAWWRDLPVALVSRRGDKLKPDLLLASGEALAGRSAAQSKILPMTEEKRGGCGCHSAGRDERAEDARKAATAESPKTPSAQADSGDGAHADPRERASDRARTRHAGGGCGCGGHDDGRAAARQTPVAERDEADGAGCACGCGGRGDKTRSSAANVVREAGHSDLSDGREDLGLRGLR